VATPAFAGRLAVVFSTTALAVVALGGVAAASPSDASGTPNSHAAAATSTTHGQQNKTDDHGNSKGNGSGDSKGNGDGGGGEASSHATGGTAGTSGDPTQPQPVSNADQNSGGANGQCPGGPYCSTRDGSPSGNGNGTGKSVGKPCAGCVGKADNKNPKGQMPNGSDHNAGYECDRNHGIGRGNPAHTGCTSAPTPVTTCPAGEVMVAGTCTTPAGDSTGTCPAGEVMVAGTCTTPGGDSTGTECAAGQVMLNGDCTTPAKTCPEGESMSGLACVLGTGFTKKPVAGTTAGVGVSVLGERVVRTPQVIATATSLPFTGAPTGELLLLAAAALTVGGGLTVAGRRKAQGA
jgi:hypothetical protein